MAGSFADFASALTFSQASSGIIPLTLPCLSHFRLSCLTGKHAVPMLAVSDKAEITSLRFLMSFWRKS